MGERGGGSSSIGLNWILMSLFFSFRQTEPPTPSFPLSRSIRRRRQRERGGEFSLTWGWLGIREGLVGCMMEKKGWGLFPHFLRSDGLSVSQGMMGNDTADEGETPPYFCGLALEPPMFSPARGEKCCDIYGISIGISGERKGCGLLK